AINQTAGTITANNLGARALTGISLTSTGNDADTVAFANTGAGTIAYQDTDGFTVGALVAQTLGSGNASFAATSGVVSRGLATDDVLLQSRGVTAGPTTALAMTLTTNVNAGAADVRLVSADAINQTAGTITANNLGARAVTGISLTSTGNDADTVAFANTGAGTIAYQDTDGFTVGALVAQTLGSGNASFAATSGVVSR